MKGRWLVALIVGVCILSAGIGAGVTLLAKEGPEGAAGPAGEIGPRGPRGFEAEETAGENAEEDVGNVQDQAYELEERIEHLENENFDLEFRAEEATQEAANAESYAESVCRALPPELGVIC